MIPPGWYGFVAAAGPGIVRLAHIDPELGMAALKRLGEPEQASRSQDFEGRRMVRIDGGFVVLNFMKYREFDHSAKDRMRRLRESKKRGTVTRNVTVVHPNVTHSREQIAEAEAEAYTNNTEASPQKAGEDVPIPAEKTPKPKTDLQLRTEKLFKRRESTLWDDTEKKAWLRVRGAVESTHADDWVLLEWFYALPASAPTFRRHSLATLLNNWGAEIDRARDYQARNGSPSSSPELLTPAEIERINNTRSV